MRRGPIELVVFDIAGTTVRDEGEVLDAFARAADAVGLVATREELNARMGKGKFEVFDELARRQHGDGPEAARVRDAGYEAFQRLLEEGYAHRGVTAIDGAVSVFRWLRERGIAVALNTGFYRRVTDIIVDSVGFRAEVDAVVTTDDVPAGRPRPYMIHHAMAQCGTSAVTATAVVGDTPSDAQAGYNAGARMVVGVTTGAHGAARLRAEPVTQVVDGVWVIPELVQRAERLARTR